MIDISCIPSFYGNLVAMTTRLKTLTTSLSYAVLSSYLVWRFLLEPHTLLIWKISCRGNQNETSITPLS